MSLVERGEVAPQGEYLLSKCVHFFLSFISYSLSPLADLEASLIFIIYITNLAEGQPSSIIRFFQQASIPPLFLVWNFPVCLCRRLPFNSFENLTGKCSDFSFPTFIEAVQLYKLTMVNEWSPSWLTGGLFRSNICKRHPAFIRIDLQLWLRAQNGTDINIPMPFPCSLLARFFSLRSTFFPIFIPPCSWVSKNYFHEVKKEVASW